RPRGRASSGDAHVSGAAYRGQRRARDPRALPRRSLSLARAGRTARRARLSFARGSARQASLPTLVAVVSLPAFGPRLSVRLVEEGDGDHPPAAAPGGE